VELHGGTITAASEGDGHGATFTIELPLAPPPSPAESAAPAEPDQVVAPDASGPAPGADPDQSAGYNMSPSTDGKPHKLRILLIEDHADTAQVMARFLRIKGHDVCVARSAAEASEALAQMNSDNGTGLQLVISDIGLPDGNGH